MAPVRIAVMAFANPEDNTRIVRAVRKALGPLLKTRGIDLKFCTFEEFEREAVSKKTDLVLGTSGHIRRLAHHNIQPIATIVAHPGADPNRAEGTAVVVRSDRFELQTLGDLRTRIVAANNPLGFTGWQIVLGEIAKFGVEEPLDVILTFATPSTFHGVAKHAIFAGVQRQRRSAPAEQGAQHL